jgi:uncharacterized membrane protein HdeD (DUF308 family)
MSSIENGMEQSRHRVLNAIRRHWVLFLIEGVVLVVFGAIAIILPGIAALAVTILLGWLFLFSGILGLITTIWMRELPGFWWSLLSALLAIITGVALLAWPFGGVLSLTLVLAVFFVIEGVASILYALDHRREFTGRWGWMLASGVVDLVLAMLILVGFPGTASWAIGLLVGINMLMGGVALMAMALHARTSDTTGDTIARRA